MCCRDGSPILVTIVSFWHFAVIRGQTLTPSIAFTSVSQLVSHGHGLTSLAPTLDPRWVTVPTFLSSILISHLVFNEMKFALNALPETFINMLQVRKYKSRAHLTEQLLS